ncbi:MAG: hypothetical protein OK438_04415 [Thaumarchaeota archaeon]|nr:hypothetical protein [Nitrososphaerota archaeon]
MSDTDSSAPELPKKRRSWRFVAVVMIIGLALVGFLAYATYQNAQCDHLVGCGPFPTLSIQGGRAQVGSLGPTICQTTEFTAVCPIYIVGETSGDVTLKATFQGVNPGTYVGGAYVAFLVYSSAAHYVNFTSIPDCAFTSGPSLDARGCNVPSNGSVEFRFNFTVSSSYAGSGQSWPDSVTVYMWQSCCFP